MSTARKERIIECSDTSKLSQKQDISNISHDSDKVLSRLSHNYLLTVHVC